MAAQLSNPRIHHIPRVLRRVEQLGHYAAAVGKRVAAEAFHLRSAGYPLAFLELVPGTVLLAHDKGLRVLQGEAEPSESRALVAAVMPTGTALEDLPRLSMVRPNRGMPSGFTYGNGDCSGTWDNLSNFDYFGYLSACVDFKFINAELDSLIGGGVHALQDRYWTRTAQVRELPAGLALVFRNERFEVVNADTVTTSGALAVSNLECSSPTKLAIFYRDAERPWPLKSTLSTSKDEPRSSDSV